LPHSKQNIAPIAAQTTKLFLIMIFAPAPVLVAAAPVLVPVVFALVVPVSADPFALVPVAVAAVWISLGSKVAVIALTSRLPVTAAASGFHGAGVIVVVKPGNRLKVVTSTKLVNALPGRFDSASVPIADDGKSRGLKTWSPVA